MAYGQIRGGVNVRVLPLMNPLPLPLLPLRFQRLLLPLRFQRLGIFWNR